MAGLPLTQQTASALMSGMKQASPPPNPATANNRTLPQDKFLERIRSIKAILKVINTESPPEDGLSAQVLDSFQAAINKMLLGAPGQTVMDDLKMQFGAGPMAPPQGMGGQPPMPMGGQAPAPMGGGPPPMPGPVPGGVASLPPPA